MSRRSSAQRRKILPDPKFNDLVVAKFMNVLMSSGKKAVAESIFYDCLDIISEKVADDPLKVFKKCVDNVKPVLEVKTRRIGGANYQVPVEVKPYRKQSLAIRWIIEAARGRGEKTMTERLAAEVLEASNERGASIKKRDDVHKMAEANKAFAHLRW